MTDSFERLKDALQRDPPPPETRTRDTALDAATARFQEIHAANSQGMAAPARPTSRGGTGPSSIWSGIMNILKPSKPWSTPALAGGASLAVLTLALVSTHAIRPDLLPWPEFRQHTSEQQETEQQIAQHAPEQRAAKQDPSSAPTAKPETLAEADGRAAAPQETVIGGQDSQVAAPEPAPSTAPPQVAQPQVAAEWFGDAGQALTGGSRDLSQGFARKAAPSRNELQSGPQPRTRTGVLAIAPDGEAPAHILREQGRDKFEAVDPNPVKVATEEPVSTFSIDVDTASYGFMRARLNAGVLPPADAVRVEELINYFPYDYASPEKANTPFKANVSIMPSPWNAETKLMRIGIKGLVPPAADRPNANLVFLIDTSGSMQAPNKLPLLRNAFRLLLTSLDEGDTVAIVTYAGSAGTALEPTKVSEQAKILAALDRLTAGGRTAGAEGIRQAYKLAEANKVDGINRVILATDGDFNVGISDKETLKSFVARKRETGVSLSVLGFGAGNYNDALMQTLAQNGNGNAAYIDTLNEARKVFVDEVGATLQTIAKDVKIQVEFNPAAVAEYRLIGYETRILAREDFNNDKVDAGEIGAGHSVTALYEYTPVGSKGKKIDDLRYGSDGPAKPAANAQPDEIGDEIAFVKIRYKQPGGDTSTLIETPVRQADEVNTLADADDDARFAVAVAGFGQVLKGGRYTGGWTIKDAITLAEGARGKDRFGYRNEFVNLARLAETAAAIAPLQE